MEEKIDLTPLGCRAIDDRFVCKFHLNRTSGWEDEPDNYGKWVKPGFLESELENRQRELERKYPTFNIKAITTQKRNNEFWIESRLTVDNLKELIKFLELEDVRRIVMTPTEIEVYDDYRE